MINGNNNVYREPTKSDLEDYKAFNLNIELVPTPEERITELEKSDDEIYLLLADIVGGAI